MDHPGLIEEFIEVIRPLAGGGRRGIAIGGSRAKGRTDAHSDYDFRLYTDGTAGLEIRGLPGWPAFAATMQKWEQAGVHIDGVWTRRITDMDAALDRWIAGQGEPDDYVWTVWGYHPLTDLFHQTVLEDPDGILAGWKARLASYPPTLKQVTLERHLAFLRYWRTDYHYRSKVTRGDVVFLAGLSAKLVHAMMQVLFALNETYYPGDGWNLKMAGELAVAPENLVERVTAALYPTVGDGRFERQYAGLAALIDEIVALAAAQSSSR